MGRTKELKVRGCLGCGAALPPDKPGRGRPRLYCSSACGQRFKRREAWLRENAAAVKEMGITVKDRDGGRVKPGEGARMVVEATVDVLEARVDGVGYDDAVGHLLELLGVDAERWAEASDGKVGAR